MMEPYEDFNEEQLHIELVAKLKKKLELEMKYFNKKPESPLDVYGR